MSLRERLSVLSGLTRDTFRQSMASSVFWLMLGVSAMFIAVGLSVDVVGDVALYNSGERPDFLPRGADGGDPASANAQGVSVVRGELTIAFGAIRVPIGRDRTDAMRYLQLILAGLVADTAGILLTLVWTAAFLPSFLEPSALSVLLTKPIPRSYLLVGKYLGVLAFVLLQATVFIGGTWLALGVRTGMWDPTYLLSIPLLLMHFAIFFSFSVLLAVCTRSTMVCVLGSIVFWFLCWGMNFGRHAVVAAPHLSPDNTYASSLRWITEVGYWLLPKPADLGMIMFDALQAGKFFDVMASSRVVQEQNEFFPILSVASSLLITAFFLAATVEQFKATDY